MKLKKLAIVLACAVTVAGMPVMGNLPIQTSAEETQWTTLDVAKTTNISSDANNYDTAVSFYPTADIVSGASDYQEEFYQFTITETSYVTVTTKSDTVEWNFNADLTALVSSSKTFASTIMDWTTWSIGSVDNGTALLEPGTYYIKVSLQLKSDASYRKSKEQGAYTTVGVVAQPISRSANTTGDTVKTAIPAKADTYAVGLLTATNKQQYFKFTLSKKSDITVKIAQSCPTNLKIADSTITLLDADGLRVENSASQIVSDNTVSLNYSLSKGTYYILATANSTNKLCASEVNVKYTVNKSYNSTIGTLKVTTAKAGTKKISGKTITGATVKVTVNGKTYKTTASKTGKYSVTIKSKLKTGTKIKVTATKTGFTKKTISYTVK